MLANGSGNAAASTRPVLSHASIAGNPPGGG